MLSLACSRPPSDLCPASLHGETEPNYYIYGGSEKIVVRLVSVAVECLPVPHRAAQSKASKADTYTSYEIAATAVISYKINDPDYLKSSIVFGDVIFEDI